MAVGCNVGDQHAMFEPIHGSAPRHAGKGRANPMAMILAIKEGLEWFAGKENHGGLKEVALALEASVVDLLEAGAPLTYDLVGEELAASTSTVGDAVVQRLRERMGRE